MTECERQARLSEQKIETIGPSGIDVREEIVRYNIALPKHSGFRSVAKRGKVRDMSLRSRRRLIAAAKRVQGIKEGQCLCLTLTTTLQCPKTAKKRLKKWIDAMRYRHPGHCGVFVAEVQLKSWNIHYHVALRLFDGVEIEAITVECWKVWKKYNPELVRNAFYCERVQSWEHMIRYFAKDENHAETYQKALPPTLPDGFSTNWWGMINQRKIRHSPKVAAPIRAPEDKPADSLPLAA